MIEYDPKPPKNCATINKNIFPEVPPTNETKHKNTHTNDGNQLYSQGRKKSHSSTFSVGH